MWHSIAGECPLHTYRRCKGQNVARRLAGDCLHFLVDRFGSSHWGGRGHYSSHHTPATSNHGLQTLTFSRPSKIKSITLWPRTGKHCVGINHLPFHAWLCSLFLDVWLSVWFGGNGWLAVWETDWLTGFPAEQRTWFPVQADSRHLTLRSLSLNESLLILFKGNDRLNDYLQREVNCRVKSSSRNHKFTSLTQRALQHMRPIIMDIWSRWDKDRRVHKSSNRRGNRFQDRQTCNRCHKYENLKIQSIVSIPEIKLLSFFGLQTRHCSLHHLNIFKTSIAAENVYIIAYYK